MAKPNNNPEEQTPEEQTPEVQLQGRSIIEQLKEDIAREPDFYVNLAPDSWVPILRIIRSECGNRGLQASAKLMEEFLPVYIKMERMLKEQGLIRFSSIEQDLRDQERETKNNES